MDHGIVPHARQPQRVEQFIAALAQAVVMGNHIHHLHPQSSLGGIQGQKAAEKKEFIVGMGGHHQQIRLLAGRLPDLHPVRQTAGREGADVAETDARGLRQTDRDLARGRGKRHIFVQKAALPRRRGAGGRLQRPGERVIIPAQVQPADLLLRRNGDRSACRKRTGRVELPVLEQRQMLRALKADRKLRGLRLRRGHDRRLRRGRGRRFGRGRGDRSGGRRRLGFRLCGAGA